MTGSLKRDVAFININERKLESLHGDKMPQFHQQSIAGADRFTILPPEEVRHSSTRSGRACMRPL